MAGIKKSGSYAGQSNALGFGGRAAQLAAKGVPGGVIGNLARTAGAAPGQKNYHGDAPDKAKKQKAAPSWQENLKAGMAARGKKG